MRYFYTRLMFILIISAFCSIPALARVVEVDGLAYDINSETKEASVIECDYNLSGDLVIPSSIEVDGIDYSVTSIGESAFEYCYKLISVTIPNSVTSIGDWAFSECYELTSVNMSDSVTHIGTSCFAWCTGLTSPIIVNDMFVFLPISYSGHYDIPENITTIIGGAFEDCESLTSVSIPNSVSSIGEGAFCDCVNLTSVTIPNSVTSIGDFAFRGTGLTTPIIVKDIFVFLPESYSGHYDIPENVTTIIGGAFADCEILTSVSIPNSVTSIGVDAFCECFNLTTVTISNSVTYIGEGAFSDCESLTSITIPNSITSIEDYTFYDCPGLTTINIPSSVTSIGEYAFNRCTGLTTINIPNSVASIGRSAFGALSSIASVTCEIPTAIEQTDNYEDFFYNCFYGSPIEQATLYVPESSLDSYKATYPWSDFGTILPLSSSGLENLTVDDKAQTVDAIYNLDGNRYHGSKRGVNIIRMKDGKTKKVLR